MTELEKKLKAKIPGADTGIGIRPSICAICSPDKHCGLDCYVKDGKIIKIEGTPDHPYNHGKLCTKGCSNRNYLYRKDRIQTPLKRVGERGEGKFEPISWEEAYQTIADNLNRMLNFALLEQIPPAMRPSWGAWVCGLGVPALLLGAMMCFVQLKLFPGPKTFHFSPELTQEELNAMGPLSAREIKTLFWLLAAVTLWMTDQIHGVDLGWVTLGIAVMMSLPVIGDVVTKDDWAEINMGTLLFLTACIAIAGVGGVTGMNAYLADLILPSSLHAGLVGFALVGALVTMLLHLALGSVMATYALVTPALLTLAEPLGFSPMVVAFIVYIGATTQYLFPYQSLYVTIGLGDRAGGYTAADVIRFGLACTIPVLICVVFSIGWWNVIGWV